MVSLEDLQSVRLRKPKERRLSAEKVQDVLIWSLIAGSDAIHQDCVCALLAVVQFVTQDEWFFTAR